MTNKPREFWLDHDCYYTQSEIEYSVSTEYPINPVNLVHTIEYSAFEELKKENARLKETISYLPKVPAQPYEKELAQKYQALLEQAEMMAETIRHVHLYADKEFGWAQLLDEALKQWQEFKK